MPITHEDLCVATKADQPFSRDGWIFELKYDGFRILASRHGEQVSLLSRKGTDFTQQFPEIAAELKEFPDVVLDCELVMLDPDGVPQFEPRHTNRAWQRESRRPCTRHARFCIGPRTATSAG